jgi:lysophospholipase L1-like esterase
LPLAAPTPIEDPTGHALAGLHAALHRALSGQGQARIVFYGASHVASDLYTGVLRQRLQQRFGEAGPGFVIPGNPWRFYRNAGIHVDESRGFNAFRILERAPVEGVYGLAGVALDARRKPAQSAITTRANGGLTGNVSHAELYYWKQPNGGHLNLIVDGKRMPRIATAAQHAEPAIARFDFADGQHRFELRTQGDGPVRIFGIALERNHPGVILDTLGIPGTRARDHLFWDDAVYREHLASRKPDMVVLAYGTNESGDDDVPLDQYEAHLRRVVARVQEVAKDASCLLIGPSDRPIRNDDGTFSPRPLTEQISDVQRRVAADTGCGFFDLQRFMGGSMSMLRWVAAVPPLGTGDYIHFTQAGYERLAAVVYDDLLSGFDATAEPTPAVAARDRARHHR